MTPAAGDSALEEAFEAWLAGRRTRGTARGSGAGGTEGLVAFADAVRVGACRPGRPSAALAELLATGLLTDQSTSSARTTPAAARPARRAADRGRRRRSRMFPALFAKFASAGLVAKAATATGVAVVGLGTAGFTGALPTPAQHTFATVVSHVTPFTAPEEAPTSGSATPGITTSGITTSGTTTSDTTTSDTGGDGAEGSGTGGSGAGSTTGTGTGGTTGTGSGSDSGSTTGTGTGSATGTASGGGEQPSAPTPFGQTVRALAQQKDGHPGAADADISRRAHARNAEEGRGKPSQRTVVVPAPAAGSGEQEPTETQVPSTTGRTDSDDAERATTDEQAHGDSASHGSGHHGRR